LELSPSDSSNWMTRFGPDAATVAASHVDPVRMLMKCLTKFV